MTTLEKLLAELPPELQREVEDFAQFLVTTKIQHTRRSSRAKPTFQWAGAIKDLQEQYTSVQLQHEISSWRAA